MVTGTLLGSVVDGVVNVTSCYPIPYAKKDGELALGKAFNENMLNLHQSVHPQVGISRILSILLFSLSPLLSSLTLSPLHPLQDKVVGWYSSSASKGKDVNKESILIHDYFGHMCRAPVMLTVDTSLKENKVVIKSFSSAPVIVGEA